MSLLERIKFFSSCVSVEEPNRCLPFFVKIWSSVELTELFSRVSATSLDPAGIVITGSLREVPIVTAAAGLGLLTITSEIVGESSSLDTPIKSMLAVTPAELLRPYVMPNKSLVASFLESLIATRILSAADSYEDTRTTSPSLGEPVN